MSHPVIISLSITLSIVDNVRAFFSGSKNASEDVKDETAEKTIAVAALLIEAASADGEIDPTERPAMVGALQNQFELSQEDADTVLEAAAERQANANDLHQFTKVAKTMSYEDKIRLIEGLWQVVLADGVKDKYEDALIRRLCGLLYIDDRESGLARQRVQSQN
ncbi:MAG: TerB family tellurite resistance protein [Pseudomonadota bacterium]